jgi:PBP1b-binding outer membrane lipoprotein LpoB
MYKYILAALFLFGCSSVKKTTAKKEQQVEQGSTTQIEYRTNTIYTDTGSITTYYRDSLIFRNDTVIQPIERIVNRWYKQEVKHDTLYKLQRDTITVKVKETVTVKEKTSFPWLWLIVGGIVLLISFRANILNWVANKGF